MEETASERFSLLGYAERLRPGRKEGVSGDSDDGRTDDFRRQAEEIRSELTAARGRTEEEQQEYGDMLNRAVLGYEEDRARVLAIIQDQLAKRRIPDTLPPNKRYRSMAEAMFAEMIGMGELELLLKDREDLEEIQVIGRKIYEVRGGRVLPSVYRLQSLQELERIQQNLVLFNSDSLNPRKRWAEVRLRDGSRVTMTGFGYTSQPTLTIRFYSVRAFSLQELCKPELGTMDERVKELLLLLLRSCFNLVIIGPTNSGKTHLMKALIAELPNPERLITIESRYELMLKRDFPDKNVVEYEVDEDDRKHNGRQAFKLALRQSPQRIIHAEIREEDANLYVRACTRGHEGSMTSVHVNELEDVPEAVTDMCMLDARGMNPERLAKRIATYVTQIGIQLGMVNGKRRILRIGEIGYVNGEVTVRDLAVFCRKTERWELPLRFSDTARRRVARYQETDGGPEARTEETVPC
ncbi:hypothetical protein J31TS4_44290 [Paenibacillus sp. J31TS4]|uniref:ATPase, T2SS/T4P/T4SS family n=1 Tax=Paenibacillus sp. J31TS4 TaxID=2807195 RepID=UPI001B2B7D5A|nr:ATPase, T2SS/T4P/T4SS family [Paenibacillus sp. J31TS4]GIP41149.1 hypothetical protein J31TS4_44290 [Paenibacillus sp. J31TS4]